MQAWLAALTLRSLQTGETLAACCGTITSEMIFPSTACSIAAELGLRSTPAFDITAACSGFLYTLETGAQFVR